MKGTTQGFLLLILALAMVIFFSVVEDAEAKTITVDAAGEGDFMAIQDAIDSADPNDMISIGSGTFYENIHVDKTISLKGEGADQTIVHGNGSGDVARISAQGALVSGIAFTGSGGRAEQSAGIVVSNHSVTLSNIHVHKNTIGILIHRGNLTLLRDSNVSGNAEEGIRTVDAFRPFITGNLFEDNGNAGIRLLLTADAVITTNTFLTHPQGFPIHPGHGIELVDSIGIRISNNVFENCSITITSDDIQYWTSHTIDKLNLLNGLPIIYLRDAVAGSITTNAGQVIIANCSNIEVRGLTLNNTRVGVAVGFSHNITLDSITCYFAYRAFTIEGSGYCWIFNCSAYEYEDAGLYLHGSSYCWIMDNIFAMNEPDTPVHSTTGTGIMLSQSHANTIRTNLVHQNSLSGISLGTSNRNTLDGNMVRDNLGEGIVLDHGSSNNFLTHNMVHGNWKDGLIITQGSNDNKVSEDRYSENYCGITILDSIRTIVTGSNITENEIGVKVKESASLVIVSRCDITRNIVGLSSDERTNDVRAENNSWGNDTGPMHKERNPDGTGNIIQGNVTFVPWLDADGNQVFSLSDGDDDEEYSTVRSLLGVLLFLIVMLVWAIQSPPSSHHR